MDGVPLSELCTSRLSDDFRTFIQARIKAGQADRFIAETFLRFDHTMQRKTTDAYFDLVKDEGHDRAAISYTSYARYDKARQTHPGLDIFARETFRTRTRPSRVAQRIYKEQHGREPDGHAMDVFTQAANAYLHVKNGALDKIDIIRGDLIGKWYGRNMYCKCSDTGGLEGSCMAHEGYDRQGVFEFYKDNAEMAVILCEKCGMLQSRAIIWTDRVTGNKFMDRIYGNDRNINLMQQYATAHGWFAVYRYQNQSKLPDYQNIQLMTGQYYAQTPYFDSLRRCNICNHGYFTNHKCGRHALTIVRPTMKWHKDKEGIALPKALCVHCRRYEDVWDEDGEEYVCPNSEWCDWCDEAHCERMTCHYECADCGTEYGLGESCPNRHECDSCLTVYCGDECPNLIYCRNCGDYYCEHDECPTCYYICGDCGHCTERFVEEEDEDGDIVEREVTDCPECVRVCAVCNTTNNRWNDSWRHNGRCHTCYGVVFPTRHFPDADFITPYRIEMQRGISGTSRNYMDKAQNNYHLTMSNVYTMENLARYGDRARLHIEDYPNVPLVQDIPLPLNVRHELWLKENGRA